MGTCEGLRQILSNHDHKLATNPETEAGLLLGAYRIMKNPPANYLESNPCGAFTAEGTLAAALKAERNAGDQYANSILKIIERKDPAAAEALRDAVIEPNGHIIFS